MLEPERRKFEVAELPFFVDEQIKTNLEVQLDDIKVLNRAWRDPRPASSGRTFAGARA